MVILYYKCRLKRCFFLLIFVADQDAHLVDHFDDDDG